MPVATATHLHRLAHLLDRLVRPLDQRLAPNRNLELIAIRQLEPVAQHIAAARRVLPCNTDAFFSEPGLEAFQR